MFVMDYLRHTNCMAISGQTEYIYIKYGTQTLTSEKSVNKYLKLMKVNCYIEETFSKKNWISDNLLTKIDERQLLCAEWAIQSAEQEKIWKDKVIATKQILNSSELITAMNRNGKEIIKGMDFWFSVTKSAEKVLVYRMISKNWQHHCKILRRRIHSVVDRIKRKLI